MYGKKHPTGTKRERPQPGAYAAMMEEWRKAKEKSRMEFTHVCYDCEKIFHDAVEWYYKTPALSTARYGERYTDVPLCAACLAQRVAPHPAD
jgi:hypothetical protein